MDGRLNNQLHATIIKEFNMKKVIAILLLILTACAPVNTRNETQVPISNNALQETLALTVTHDGSSEINILSENPCRAPCFFGITPGISTENETQSLIENYPSVFSNCDFVEKTTDEDMNWILCTDVGIGFKDGYVDNIDIYIETLITLQQMIDLYGPPDQVRILNTNLPEEAPISSPTLYFSHIQTFIFLPDFEGNQCNITPDTELWSIYFVSVSEYHNRTNDDFLVPWDGYGIYKNTYLSN